MSDKRQQDRASLERVIEEKDIGVQILHPGGLKLSRELAELCNVSDDSRVLEVASGTGETACFLTRELGARVTGIDYSPKMVERAIAKAEKAGLDVDFVQGDAHNLPFGDGTFDAVLSECSVCHFDKVRALAEMARVTRAGGCVGIHDLCWADDAPAPLKDRLLELEQEAPETLRGWKSRFEGAGLTEVHALDRTEYLGNWTEEFKHELGTIGYIRAVLSVLSRWGFKGLHQVLESERIFESRHLGYGIVMGCKPESDR